MYRWNAVPPQHQRYLPKSRVDLLYVLATALLCASMSACVLCVHVYLCACCLPSILDVSLHIFGMCGRIRRPHTGKGGTVAAFHVVGYIPVVFVCVCCLPSILDISLRFWV